MFDLMRFFPAVFSFSLIVITVVHSVQPFPTSKTIFIHPNIEIVDIPGKGEGLIVTNDIKIGTALISECSLIKPIEEFDQLFNIAILEEMRNISNGKRGAIQQQLWANLAATDAYITSTQELKTEFQYVSNVTDDDILNIAKYRTNTISSLLFGLSSKINHGLPATIAVDIDYDAARAIVYAIDDLVNGTELVFDYFDLIGPQPTLTDLIMYENNYKIDIFHNEPFISDQIKVLEMVQTAKRWQFWTKNMIQFLPQIKLDLFARNGMNIHIMQHMTALLRTDDEQSKSAGRAIKKVLLSHINPKTSTTKYHICQQMLERIFVMPLLWDPPSWLGQQFIEAFHFSNVD